MTPPLGYIVVIQICNVFCITFLYYIFSLCCNMPQHHTAHVCATPQPPQLDVGLAPLAMPMATPLLISWCGTMCHIGAGLVLQCSWHLYYIVVIQICNAFCITFLYYIFALCCNMPHVHHTACVCTTHQPVGIMLHLGLALLAMCPWPPQSSRAGLAPQSSRALVPQLRFVPCVKLCHTAPLPSCHHAMLQPLQNAAQPLPCELEVV